LKGGSAVVVSVSLLTLLALPRLLEPSRLGGHCPLGLANEWGVDVSSGECSGGVGGPILWEFGSEAGAEVVVLEAYAFGRGAASGVRADARVAVVATDEIESVSEFISSS